MISGSKKLVYKQNVFMAMFSVFSKTVKDSDTGVPALFFKMSLGGGLQVYADKSKSVMLLDCQKEGKLALEWKILDSEGGGKELGSIKKNVMASVVRFGTESWSITKPDGQPLLALEPEEGSAQRHMLDAFMRIYNPAHKYVIRNTSGAVVATLLAKHGVFRFRYELILEEVSDAERKMAIALFAAILMTLRK